MVKENLFDTKEKQQQAIVAFSELMAHPGWILFSKIIDSNIENFRNQLESGLPEEKIEDVKITRQLLAFAKKMREIPSTMIEDFKRPNEGTDPGVDPYYQHEVDKK